MTDNHHNTLNNFFSIILSKNTRVYLLFLSKSEEKAEIQKATACIETDRKDIIGVWRDFLPELESENLINCKAFLLTRPALSEFWRRERG